MLPILTQIVLSNIDGIVSGLRHGAPYEVEADPLTPDNFLLINDRNERISLPSIGFRPVPVGNLYVGCVDTFGVQHLTENRIYSFDGCPSNPYIRVCNDQHICRPYKTSRFAVLEAAPVAFPKPKPIASRRKQRQSILTITIRSI